MSKPWYRSRTLWFNAICLMLFAAEANFKLLEGRIPGGLYAWLAFVLPVGNALLRFITSTALVMPASADANKQAGFVDLGLLLGVGKWLALGALVLWAQWQVYDAGRSANEARWQKRETVRLQVEQAQRDRQAALGQKAAADYIAEQRSHEENYRYFEGVFRHVVKTIPLAVRRSRPAVATGDAAAHPGPALCLDGRAGATPEPQSGAGAFSDGVDAGDLDLTGGFVWLWNSALSGTAADSRTCRIDGTTGQTDPACALGTGIDLNDALANHTVNAKACAADRLRHQRLIDYIHSINSPINSPINSLQK